MGIRIKERVKILDLGQIEKAHLLVYAYVKTKKKMASECVNLNIYERSERIDDGKRNSLNVYLFKKRK